MEQSYWLPTLDGGRIRLDAVVFVGNPKSGDHGTYVPVICGDGHGVIERVGPFQSPASADSFIRNRFPTIELEG